MAKRESSSGGSDKKSGRSSRGGKPAAGRTPSSGKPSRAAKTPAKRPAAAVDALAAETRSVLAKRAAIKAARSAPAVAPSRPAEPPLALTLEATGALPANYGIDRLVGIPRDPATLFCYWELGGPRLASLRRAKGDAFVDACAWSLRLHRLSEGWAEDIEVDPVAGCWYLHQLRAGSYQLELALLTPGGDWIPLLASHILEIPREAASEHYDEKWTADPEPLDLEALRKLDAALYPLEDALRGSSGAFVGSSRARSSSAPSSRGGSHVFLGSSGSGRPLGASSGVVSSLAHVSSFSSHSLGGSSARVPSSPGSFGLATAQHTQTAPAPVPESQPFRAGEFHAPSHPPLPPHRADDAHPGGGGAPAHTPLDVAPLVVAAPLKSRQPHFKVHLPRVVTGVPLPVPTWPSPGAEPPPSEERQARERRLN